MKILACCLLLASCTDSVDDYPVVPGSGGPTGPGTGDTSQMVRGRVCMADDLILRENCATTGIGGLAVTLGGSATTTADDGTFELPAPAGSLLAFEVSGPGAITTTTPYSPSPFIPVVNADVWATTLASNNIALQPGTGTILGTVVRGGEPATGVSVASTPSAAFGPFYDTDTGFALDGTGARGVFLVPGVTAGSASLAFAPGETTVAGIAVVNGGITILDSMVLPSGTP